LKNLFRFHPRLWIAVCAGVAVSLLLPHSLSALRRALIGWDAGVALFLILILTWMTRLTAKQICTQSADEDESAPVILAAVVLAAALSLVAIIDPLVSLKSASGTQRVGHFALALVTLVNSWLLVPTMFTTHYADLYYSATERHRPLRFPDTAEPVFWDFAYFSFTIAAACQTSDVSTAQGTIRRIVLGHTLISFLFNAAILGFAINVTAGLLGSN
jgi:uncharacterized membrane protein